MIGKRFAAGIGALALVLAPVALGVTSASAATTACGPACVDVSFVNPGHDMILKNHDNNQVNDNLILLRGASNAQPGEDFAPYSTGEVGDLYCDPSDGLAYVGSIFTNNQCHQAYVDGLMTAETYQLAADPNGGGSEQFCLGLWNNSTSPTSGLKTRLVDCGESADTVWILSNKLPGGTTSSGSWAINGASNNFSNPLVATAAGGSSVRVETAVLNGSKAVDTQEVHVHFGPAA
jgi:hypothetical protein